MGRSAHGDACRPAADAGPLCSLRRSGGHVPGREGRHCYLVAMERLRRWGWGIALAALVLYLGRIWFSDIRLEAVAAARAAVRIIRGEERWLDAPLHSGSDAAVTLLLIAAWVALALWAPRRGPVGALSLGGALPLAAQLLVACGIAAVVVLGAASIAPGVGGTALVGAATIAALGAGVAVGAAARGRAAAGADAEAAVGPSPATGLGRLVRPAVAAVSLAALVLLAAALVRDAVYLAFYRPEAAGDEANFWWRATDALHALGWTQYLALVDTAGYVPGYPLVANALFGWVPGGGWAAALRAVPFTAAFLAIALLARAAVARGPLGSPHGLLSPTAGLAYIAAFALLMPGIQGGWIHEMFFHRWYGEALATVLTLLVFVVIDHARRVASPGTADLVVLAFVAAGLGALAVISKPPLSFLLLPAVLPVLLVGGLLLRPAGSSRRALVVAVAAMAVGGLATNVLWGVQLRANDVPAYYFFDLRAMVTFHPEGSFWPLVRYVASAYQPTWLAFLLVAGLALLRDPRRFLPSLLVAIGMAGSIFLLYLGAWSDVEHESGARYLLHGLDGFTLFALAALVPAVRETLDGWLGWVEARLAGWRAGA